VHVLPLQRHRAVLRKASLRIVATKYWHVCKLFGGAQESKNDLIFIQFFSFVSFPVYSIQIMWIHINSFHIVSSHLFLQQHNTETSSSTFSQFKRDQKMQFLFVKFVTGQNPALYVRL
jgi:hypothetical protein